MENTSLIMGIIGGLIVSQVLSLANNAYARLIKSDEKRTEMMQTELQKNRDEINAVKQNIEKRVEDEILKSERQVAASIQSIDNKMASILAVFMATTNAQSGMYRTAVGMAEKDGVFLREKLENVNNDVISRYKQFIEDIEARDDTARDIDHQIVAELTHLF